MPQPKLDRAIIVKRLQAMRAAGWPKRAVTAVAPEVGVSHGSLMHTLALCPGLDPPIDTKNPDTWTAAGAEAAEVNPSERARHRQTVQKLRDDLNGAYRQLHALEDLRTACFKLAAAEIAPPKWLAEQRLPRGGPGVPILLTSDFQWGEKISSAQMDGVNAFSLPIARRRYRKMIEKTVALARNHMGAAPKYPGLIYGRLGDMISGDIHQELRETNDAASLAAVVDLVEHEGAGIQLLLDAQASDGSALFPYIWIVSVPGNHGRQTVKPHSKGYVESNYDTLSAYMLEQHFRSEPRVKFFTPASGDAIVNAYGFPFLFTHGDRIGSRGGQGLIGPAATIARGMKKTMEYYAGVGQPIYKVCIGHFHTYLELEQGFCNGSLPGMSEYGRDGRFTVQPPQQLLFFVHPEYGVTCRWPILLEPRPKFEGGSQAFKFLGQVAA